MVYDFEGVFLLNGFGDLVVIGVYVVLMICELLNCDLLIFGICFGYQMLVLVLGVKIVKMGYGYYGVNYLVCDVEIGKVEIILMNYGFVVDVQILFEGVIEIYVSLFDGSNCGLCMVDWLVFLV